MLTAGTASGHIAATLPSGVISENQHCHVLYDEIANPAKQAARAVL
jgi:hypothetical protein